MPDSFRNLVWTPNYDIGLRSDDSSIGSDEQSVFEDPGLLCLNFSTDWCSDVRGLRKLGNRSTQNGKSAALLADF